MTFFAYWPAIVLGIVVIAAVGQSRWELQRLLQRNPMVEGNARAAEKQTADPATFVNLSDITFSYDELSPDPQVLKTEILRKSFLKQGTVVLGSLSPIAAESILKSTRAGVDD